MAEIKTLEIPTLLSRIFPVHDFLPAPVLEGRPLKIIDPCDEGHINFRDALFFGDPGTMKTSLWWQAAMSFVSDGKSVLCICERVDRKPVPVQGMPLHDSYASRRILVKYVKTREEFTEVLTGLMEFTKVTSLPDAILIDDFHRVAGISDTDPECDFQLAKVCAVLREVINFVRNRKSVSGSSNGVESPVTMTTPWASSDVSLFIFSNPLRWRGSSLLPVLERFFDFAYELKPILTFPVLIDDSDQVSKMDFSLTPLLPDDSRFRLMYSHKQGKFVKLTCVQTRV